MARDYDNPMATITDDEQLLIPIRWSPPEVLSSYQWSEKSDVWSFGVIMWEIFSCGNEPYAQKSDDEVGCHCSIMV